MSEHTPGPWEAIESFPVTPIRRTIKIISRGGIGGTYVAAVYRNDTHETDLVGYAEGVANERLIAAAPDLLAACEAFNHAMESYGHPDKSYRDIYAAINKAKGIN